MTRLTQRAQTDLNFTGKVAGVTGASNGIGRAIAIGLAKRGAAVAIMDVDQGGLDETATLITAAGGSALAIQADVTSSLSLSSAVDEIESWSGPVDFLACNAGVSDVDTLTWEIPEEQWDRVHGVNLRGAWLTCKAFIPTMLDRPGGRVVFTSSAQGQRAFTGIADYCSSKFGVLGLMKVLALELASYQITSNAICPGSINTEGNRKVASDMGVTLDEMTHDYRATQILQNVIEPEDLVEATLWLYSEQAKWITGLALPVPGMA